MAMGSASGAPRRGRLVGEKRRKRLQLIGIAGAFFVTAIAMVLFFVDFGRFELPSDFDARYEAGELTPGEMLHIGGYVERGSLTTTETAEVRFTITDSLNTVPVRYQGVIPDLLTDGQGVVVDGRWVGDRDSGFLRAERVLAKHDENYESPQLRDALEERGLTPNAASGSYQ